MGQSVIHEQRDDTEELEACDEEDTDAVSQALGCPGGTLEEVVIGVQTVTPGVIGDAVRVCVFGRAPKRVFTETHEPSQQEFAAGVIGRLSEGGTEFVDKGVERKYHCPHGGTS
jgi:hypothetical protein